MIVAENKVAEGIRIARMGSAGLAQRDQFAHDYLSSEGISIFRAACVAVAEGRPVDVEAEIRRAVAAN